MGNYSYYYGEEAEQFNFFRLPKKLVRDRQFKSISSDAKILYGVLLDRMSLSMRCGWVDGENRVYIIYTIKDIMEEFECGEKTAIKFLGELCKAGLVEKKRQGQGRPNLLYVKNFNSVANEGGSAGRGHDASPRQTAEGRKAPQAELGEKRGMHPGAGIEEKPEKAQEKIPEGMPLTISPGAEPPDGIFQKSAPGQTGEVYPSQTCKKLQVKTCTNVQPKNCTKIQSKTCTDVQPNKTEYTETEYKDIYTSIYPPERNSIWESRERGDDGGERLNAAIAFFREKLEFDALASDYQSWHPGDKSGLERLNGILQILAETYCTGRKTVRIGSEDIPADVARQRLAGLNRFHIEYVLESLGQSSEPIRNVRAYLLTCLYNAPLTMDFYYQALVKSDMCKWAQENGP